MELLGCNNLAVNEQICLGANFIQEDIQTRPPLNLSLVWDALGLKAQKPLSYACPQQLLNGNWQAWSYRCFVCYKKTHIRTFRLQPCSSSTSYAIYRHDWLRSPLLMDFSPFPSFTFVVLLRKKKWSDKCRWNILSPLQSLFFFYLICQYKRIPGDISWISVLIFCYGLVFEHVHVSPGKNTLYTSTIARDLSVVGLDYCLKIIPWVL